MTQVTHRKLFFHYGRRNVCHRHSICWPLSPFQIVSVGWIGLHHWTTCYRTADPEKKLTEVLHNLRFHNNNLLIHYCIMMAIAIFLS